MQKENPTRRRSKTTEPKKRLERRKHNEPQKTPLNPANNGPHVDPHPPNKLNTGSDTRNETTTAVGYLIQSLTCGLEVSGGMQAAYF